MSVLFRYRNGLATAPALLLLIALQTSVARPTYAPEHAQHPAVEIVLVEPPPPALTSPRSPEPKALPRTTEQPRPKAVITTMPTPANHGDVALPVSAHEPVHEIVKTEASVALSAPPTQSPPPRSGPDTDLEAAYVARIRQMLNASKRYPTGREASLLRPSGSVRVWLVLDRSGQLLDRGIEKSSHSLLLDNAALKTVSTGSYPPFPPELWVGQSQRRFHVDIDFVVPNG